MNKKRLLTVLGGSLGYARFIQPTYGSELYTDSSLEGTYTDGLNTTLTKSGTPTVTESSDAYDGSKAQAFTAVAQNNAVYRNRNGANIGWYKWSIFAKRLSGAGGTVRSYCSASNSTLAYVNYSGNEVAITSEIYQEILWTSFAENPRYLFVKEFGIENFDSVVFDLTSIKLITFTSMLKTPKYTSTGDVIASAGLTVPSNLQGGIVINLDSAANPQNYVHIFLDQNIKGWDVGVIVDKVVGGTRSRVLAATQVTYVENAPLKIIKSGTIYQAFYNGVQVGADLTIEDAGIVNNTLHMQWATDPSVIFRDYTA